MSEKNDDILIGSDLGDAARHQAEGYIVHALCRAGSCRFALGSAMHDLAAGDCLIVPQQSLQLRLLHQSDDFRVEVVYVSAEFVALSTPHSNYGMRGHLALFENPVMHLTAEQQAVCALNFDYLRSRLALPHHHFHRDAMMNAVQCMIIDFFDFHVELYGGGDEEGDGKMAAVRVSSQQGVLMQRFLAMLDRGDFRRHREVSHYADELCVTPKHLSEVCRAVSGQSAIYWITRYTALDISRELRRRDATLQSVCDMFGFSSLSYFSRYVQKHLGLSPGEVKGDY